MIKMKHLEIGFKDCINVSDISWKKNALRTPGQLSVVDLWKRKRKEAENNSSE